jgi:hypothetical protein
MVDIDAATLRTDPGKIALGDVPDAVLAEAEGQPNGPACQASLSAFRSALVFRNIFTALVAVLAVLTLIALSYCLYLAFDKSFDVTGTVAAIGGIVTGAGALFLRTERNKAIKNLDDALGNVSKYCGEPVKQELT